MRKPQISLLAVSVSVASLLLASTTSFAGNAKENYKGEAMPCPVELILKDGFYVGLQAGYDSYRIVDKVAVIDADGDAISFDPRLNATGAVGGGYLGYGMYFNQFYGAYLGLEIFGNWSGARTSYGVDVTVPTVAVDSLSTRVKVKSNYGIDVIPGVKLNNASLLYVRLGYNWARVDVRETLVDDSVVFGDTSTEFSSNKTRGGFHYGVGIESTFWDNWSVRGEYTHTGFSSQSHSNDDGFITGTAAVGSTVKVADNQFLMGLSYHFNI